MQTAQIVVLVVEDEILIRMDVVDQLGALGYSLIEASSGREALQALASTGPVHILLTDVDMPGDPNGLMLAREVSETRPEIGIIVTSGKTSLRQDLLPQGSRFYPKPYMPAAFHLAIQELLALSD